MNIQDFELVEFTDTYILGDKMLTKAKELNITTGKKEVNWLLEHQDQIPKDWQKYSLIFPEYLDGSGVGDDRRVACFYWSGERWVLGWGWFVNYFRSFCRFVRVHESLDSGKLDASWPLETLEINGVKYRKV